MTFINWWQNEWHKIVSIEIGEEVKVWSKWEDWALETSLLKSLPSLCNKYPIICLSKLLKSLVHWWNVGKGFLERGQKGYNMLQNRHTQTHTQARAHQHTHTHTHTHTHKYTHIHVNMQSNQWGANRTRFEGWVDAWIVTIATIQAWQYHHHHHLHQNHQ